MCKNNCKTCGGYRKEGCFKGIDNKIAKEVCKEWFPSECPITGMKFGGIIYESDGNKIPVYYFSPYTSYTLPEYDEKYKEFIRRKYDEDEGCWDDSYETLCSLEDLEEEVSKERLEEIKKFYDIKD